MHCPKCAIPINDPFPQCPQCGFHIRDLDKELGSPPERNNLVCDLAKAMGEPGLKLLCERLQAFTDRTGYAFYAVTIQTTAPRLPSEYVFWLFNRWNVGGDPHLGILMLLAIQERRIEVEVGCDLERFISDDAAAAILQHHAVPFLKRGRIDDGLYYAADVLGRFVEELALKEPRSETSGISAKPRV